MARWKAHCRYNDKMVKTGQFTTKCKGNKVIALHCDNNVLLVITEHFSLFLTVETLLADFCRNRWIRTGRVGHFKQIFGGMEGRPPTTVGVRKLESAG